MDAVNRVSKVQRKSSWEITEKKSEITEKSILAGAFRTFFVHAKTLPLCSRFSPSVISSCCLPLIFTHTPEPSHG